MSAEVAKKRGRPKKAVLESEPAKTTAIRQKSTKLSTRPRGEISSNPMEFSNTTTKGASAGVKPAPKTVGKNSRQPFSSSTSTAPSSLSPPALTPSSKPTAASTHLNISPGTSKILNQVRALSSNPPSSKPQFTAPIQSRKTPPAPTKTRTAPTPPPPPPAQSSQLPLKPSVSPPSSASKVSKPPPPIHPSSPSPSLATAVKSIPIAALNSTIVSQLSQRAGSRPVAKAAGAGGVGSKTGSLPPNYRQVARKVTMAMVAMPIVIVTSWILYQRLVLGEERKPLVRPGMAMVEGNSTARDHVAGRPSKT